jgi:hypothetical protein
MPPVCLVVGYLMGNKAAFAGRTGPYGAP